MTESDYPLEKSRPCPLWEESLAWDIRCLPNQVSPSKSPAAAAAAAKLCQSCPTLCDPMDCSLPGSSIHGMLQARVLEWGAIAFSIQITYNLVTHLMALLPSNG